MSGDVTNLFLNMFCHAIFLQLEKDSTFEFFNSLAKCSIT